MRLLDRSRTWLPLTILALFGVAGPAAGQTTVMDDPGVAVMNDSPHQLKVYAYRDTPSGDRALLGWVGADELEFFRVPADVKTMLGAYHIAVQQVTPLPQIGVPAEAHPLMATPRLDPELDETVRITVSEDLDLSHVVVR